MGVQVPEIPKETSEPEDLNRDLFDAKDIPCEASHLIGMEQQGIFLIGSILRVEPAGIERWVEIPRVCVGIAINGCPGAVQCSLDVVNGDQCFIPRGIHFADRSLKHTRIENSANGSR